MVYNYLMDFKYKWFRLKKKCKMNFNMFDKIMLNYIST